jgi:hypothetical protein
MPDKSKCRGQEKLSSSYYRLGVGRGRVSKYVINGSKTALMDVIGFLCVSLCSSIIQLHDNFR